ncbi:IPT/TIG domain-containing protein [Asanoa hainanensis]|uniref:IPT/TIG domain-containing protein n=1 Tax=Asanoa hainanensis TaxID=560556 RepID=UPI000B77BF85|nr:IPT/TIG domain-containing protein [Asanoa hainanensis]
MTTVSILAVPGPALAVDPVSVDTVTPAVVEAGAVVELRGHGFTGASAVTINGVLAATTAVADDRITATVPAAATSGPVRVTAPAGTGAWSSDLFVARSPWRATDVETTARLTLDAPATVAVATASKVALLTVTTAPGRRVALALRDSTFGSSTSNARVSVFRPDGTTAVSATGFGTSGVFLEPLPAADLAYTVLVDPQGTATGQVVVTAHDVPADALVPGSADGSTVTVATTVPGQNGGVTFAGKAGQRVSIAVSGSTYGSSGVTVGVRRPDGTSLVSAVTVSTSAFLDLFVLPAAGTYTVAVDPVRAATGQVAIRLFDVPADATVAGATDGAARTVTTTTPGQNGGVEFTATAGQRVGIRVPSHTYGSGSVSLSVRRPDGTNLVGATTVFASLFVEPVTIPSAGLYSVVVNPAGDRVGAAVVHLYDTPADAVFTATPGGAAVSATVGTPGQNARVEFAGAAGQRVSFRVPSHSFGSGNVSIGVRRPDGTVLVAAQTVFSSLFTEPVTLPVGGTYAVVVDPAGASTGAATVEVHDVPTGSPVEAVVGGPAVTLATTVPGQNGSVTFAAVAGQRVSVRLSASTYGTSGARATLLAPDGSVAVAATTFSAAGVLLGPLDAVAGVYTVAVDPQGSAVGQVTVLVSDAGQVVFTATVDGGPVVAATTAPGQDAVVRFPLAAGQRYIVTALESTYGGSSNVRVSLRAPDGTVLVAPTGVASNGIYFDTRVSTVAGDHSVLVDPQGSAVGQIAIEVRLVPADLTAVAAVGGEPVTLPATVMGQGAVVTFAGTAGQRVALLASGSTYSGSNVRVGATSPDGSVLFGTSSVASNGIFWNPVALPADGTYQILVDPQSTVVGQLTLRLYLVPADVTGVATVGAPASTVVTSTPGQNATVTFVGTAAQRVFVRVGRTSSTGSAAVELRAPDGTVLRSATTSGTTLDLAAMALPATGGFTVAIDPQSTAVDTFTVQVFAVPDDTTVAATLDGPAVIARTTQPGQVATVTFPAPAGRRALLTVTPGTVADGTTIEGSVALTLRDPAGTVLTSGTITATDERVLGPVDLGSGGTYSLTLDPTGTRFGRFTVQVFEVPAAVPVPLTVGGPAVEVAVRTPGAVGAATFTAAAGDRVCVSVPTSGFSRAGVAGSAAVSLVDAAGGVLANATASGSAVFLEPLTLAAAGTYRVLVDPAGAAVGAASVAVCEVPADVTVAGALGAAVRSVDLAVGQRADLAFSGTAGQAIRAGLPVAAGLARLSILRADGTQVCTRTNASAGSVLACALPAAGDYLVRVDPNGSIAGAFGVEVYEGTGSPRISGGTTAWSAIATPGVSWSTDSATAIDGYAVVVDSVADTVPPPAISQPGASLSRTYPDGVSWVHVRAHGTDGSWGATAHRAVRVDTVTPVVNALTSPSHPDPAAPTGSLDLRLALGATTGPSGVAGYSIKVSRTDGEVPGTAITTTGNAYETRLAGEGEWFVAVVARSGAGKASAPVRLRVVADLAADAPTVTSATHPVPGTGYPAGPFVATWRLGPTATAPVGESVGLVDGWSVVLDTAAATVPAATVTTTEARFSAELAPGTWWLHVRGHEVSGAWSATAHFRVVVVAADEFRFTAPAAGTTLWDDVSVALDCAGAGGPVRVEAARDGGAWHVIGQDACTVLWETDVTVAGVPSWPDGRYTVRALVGTSVRASTTVTVDNAADSIGRLAADYAAGLLDLEQYVGHLFDLATGGAGLPARYVDGAPGLGDPEAALAAALALWESLSADQRARLGDPNTPVVLSSPPAGARLAPNECGWLVRLRAKLYDCRAESTNFVVYYDSGHVGPTSPGASRPDWVEKMIGSLELSRGIYGSMGYRLPGYRLTVALDPTFALGDNKSGVAFPSLPKCPFLCGETSPLLLMSSDPTISKYLPHHEFFHFVEYEYIDHRRFAEFGMNWWMEASAEWAAHQVHERSGASDVPDDEYRGYWSNLDDFLDASDERFDEGNSVVLPGGPEYGAFIVAEFLEERFGDDAIRQTWGDLGGLWSTPRGAIREAIEAGGSSFGTEIDVFRQWAYVFERGGSSVGFTDSHAQRWRASLGSALQPPRQQVTISQNNGAGPEAFPGTYYVQQSGAKYVQIVNPNQAEGDLTVTWDPKTDHDVRFSVLRLDDFDRPTAGCGAAQRLLARVPLTVALTDACPKAVLVIVNADDPGFYGTWAIGDWSVRFQRTAQVLSNSTIEIGVGPYGSLISNAIGIRLAGNADSEVIRRGCFCEGWGVAHGPFGGSVTDATGVDGLTLSSFVASGDTATSMVDLTGPTGITVATYVSPSIDPNLFQLKVTVRNVSSPIHHSVHYRRAVDWDLLPDVSGFYTTFVHRTGDIGYVTGVTNDGFADPNPHNAFTDLGASGFFTDFGPANTGALIDLDLGTFATGEAKTFDLYYGIAPTEARATAAVAAVGAQLYALGQPGTADGKTLGTPYTGIFAIDGSGLPAPSPRLVAPQDNRAPSVPGVRREAS